MKKLLPLLLCTCAVTASADTIPVPAARMAGPLAFRLPYVTDSVDMKGKAYDVQEILQENAAFALRANAGQSLARGTALLPAGSDSAAHYLSAIHFTLSTPRFAVVRLNVKQLKHYKTYVNRKEFKDKELQLTPGRTEVVLLGLSTTADRDSFYVELTGDDLKGVTVNNTGKRPYTMADMLQGDHYHSVALSPSGKYLITRYYDTKADGTNLFRTTLTETESGRELMHWNSYESYNWMPRRDVIYFTRNGAEGRELVTLDPATGAETVLDSNLPEGGFSIAPTEDFLVFTRTKTGQESRNGLKRLEQPDDRQPGWRNRTALYLYDLKQGQLQRLTFGSVSSWLRSISPDGKRLLISHSRMDTRRRPFDRTTLVEMDVNTGRVDTVLSDTTFISGAQYAPDGKRLLITASPAAFGGIGSEVAAGQIPSSYDNRLYLYDLSAHTAKPLLKGFDPAVGSATWSYGDGYVYFKATDGCDERLFRLDPESGEVVRYNLAVSYVQGYSISYGKKRPTVVYYGQTGTRARELFRSTLDGNAAPKSTRIGDIDFDKMYADVAIGECHDWKFQSSRGDSISGFYFLPPDFAPAKKYPLIVYYYGGCTPTTKSLEFQYPLQVLAGQGYVVYVCEPSGAIGYGQEFAARHVNTWGQGSAQDIIEGTRQFLKEHPFANPDKVGCMGASYGGFMTQYLQTQTDLFAAAVSHAGISNITSYWGGGYWGYTYGETAQFGSFPWNNPDLYIKQSPLFQADKIHTPLLLLHGTADTNVPTNESQQLFTALRILGRPVSYIQVDGENHVIVNYNKRLAWQNAIFAWLAYWLKDEPLWWKTLYPDDNFGLDD